jgi:predicted nucleic acid-binding protein
MNSTQCVTNGAASVIKSIHLVLDTNVVASGLLWDNIPWQLLQAAHEKNLCLFTNSTLQLEPTDVLERAELTRKLKGAQMSVDQIVESYSLLTSIVHPKRWGL